ncbi:factor-independent urate hydroxylase [Streptosporangium sp. 'caverna']|uniref:factor-independent urate hydroxylase n=1 Tax=Streptosporangium sp. 'caverna' TaxID=2202249 RepID=UPI000D7EAB1D|nr:urate oxidase [Streptosporangium sp. 'caverna']AWS41996.1 urate oxidase [Streptosporangium sp. 'caverna']
MTVILGPNRYGKAETRLVRVVRDGVVHHIKDVTVSSALSGDMEDVHLTGDNASVLTTDTQKNTVYAFARKHGVAEIEDFAILLARHYVESQPTVHHARVEIEEYFWDRIPVADDSAPGAEGKRHSFVRSGREVRTCLVHHDIDGTTTVVSGLKDLVVLNSTDSEFSGYIQDEYTTLPPTRDRVLATAVSARWRHLSEASPYGESYAEVRGCLLGAFAETYSLSLQQTLYAMGERVLNAREELCEVRLAMPNKHHFLVDLTPFGLDNPNEVFYAADRPYGLIEGTVLRDDAPAALFAWE